MTIEAVLIALISAVFAVAALLAIIRMIKGPSILDRALASDVLLTMVLCVLGADAAINERTDTLPVMLMIAATGVLGTVAVARFVARRDRSDGTEARGPRDRDDAEAPGGAANSGTRGGAVAEPTGSGAASDAVPEHPDAGGPDRNGGAR